MKGIYSSKCKLHTSANKHKHHLFEVFLPVSSSRTALHQTMLPRTHDGRWYFPNGRSNGSSQQNLGMARWRSMLPPLETGHSVTRWWWRSGAFRARAAKASNELLGCENSQSCGLQQPRLSSGRPEATMRWGSPDSTCVGHTQGEAQRIHERKFLTNPH